MVKRRKSVYAVSAMELALPVSVFSSATELAYGGAAPLLGSDSPRGRKDEVCGRPHTHAAEGYVNLSKSSGMILRASGDGLNASAVA